MRPFAFWKTLDGNPDGPYETHHFARYGGHRFLFRLSLDQQVHIAVMESMTRLGRDLLNLGAHSFLSFAYRRD